MQVVMHKPDLLHTESAFRGCLELQRLFQVYLEFCLLFSMMTSQSLILLVRFSLKLEIWPDRQRNAQNYSLHVSSQLPCGGADMNGLYHEMTGGKVT
jgi:hypothetical protein